MPHLGFGHSIAGRRGRAPRGPEQAPGYTGSNWALSLNGGAAGTVTQDATGVTFAGAQNVAACSVTPTGGLIDNATYEITYTVSGLTGGTVRALMYGPTNNHVGSGATRSANGTYTEQITLANPTTAFLNQIRFQATGANGTNSFKVTLNSIKQVTG